MIIPISILIIGLLIVYITFTKKWTRIGATIGGGIWAKLKWWQKGALVGLGLGAVAGFLTIISGGYFAIVNLPVIPIFIFFNWLLEYFTKGADVLMYFGEKRTFILVLLIHFISWTLVGIVYAGIFHTIRRLTKHFQKNKRQ